MRGRLIQTTMETKMHEAKQPYLVFGSGMNNGMILYYYIYTKMLPFCLLTTSVFPLFPRNECELILILVVAFFMNFVARGVVLVSVPKREHTKQGQDYSTFVSLDE